MEKAALPIIEGLLRQSRGSFWAEQILYSVTRKIHPDRWEFFNIAPHTVDRWVFFNEGIVEDLQ